MMNHRELKFEFLLLQTKDDRYSSKISAEMQSARYLGPVMMKKVVVLF